MIVAAVKDKQVQVRVDHQTGCLRFGEAVLESDNMRQQLTTLATHLHKVSEIIQPPNVLTPEKTAERVAFFTLVKDNMDNSTTWPSTARTSSSAARRRKSVASRSASASKPKGSRPTPRGASRRSSPR